MTFQDWWKKESKVKLPLLREGIKKYIDMEDIKKLLEEYKTLAGNTDVKSEEWKNEIIAKLETMDKDAVAEVAKPFVEENVTRLESEVTVLRSQIDAEAYKLLPISYIAKNYFNKSASWLLQRLNGYKVRGKVYTLDQEQKSIFNQAVKEISNRISALQLA